MHVGIDADGTVCSFQSYACTAHMTGAGGFDEHHAWPVSLGGPADTALLILCPNHHRRQHSLIRYLVETPTPDWGVLQHFTSDERSTAIHAVDQWRAAGSPPIAGWPAPAARDA